MSDLGVDWEQRVDWDRLRTARIESAVAAMRAHGLDALIVQRVENLRFLTSMRPFTSLLYYPRYGAVIFASGHVCLLTESGDYALAQRGMPWIKDLRHWPYDTDQVVANLGALFADQGLRAGRVGYDDVTAPAVLFALARAHPDLDLVDANHTMGLARLIKDPEEIAVIRGAAQVAEIGMAAARAAIAEGVRESSIAAEMARAMLAAGADALVTHPQVTTDALRRMATDKRLRHGDTVLIDINICYNGYIGDFARTFAVGTPSAEQKRVFAVQRDCLDTAISLVKPGVDPQVIQDAVESIIRRAGLTDHWHGYITGHGVGVGIGPIEQPLIGSTMGPVTALQPGMVIAFEPGIFNPAIGPIRNEEMVLVTQDGHELLTRFGFCDRLSAA